MRTICASLLALFLLLAPAALRAQPVFRSEADLARHIDRILGAEPFQNAHWGVLVLDLASGEAVYARNAGKSFVPASNVKLYTVAAALDQLGPGYRYQTGVYASGPTENGVLDGNLIVRGSGDPTIGGPEQEDDPTAVFDAWADTLRAAGIRHIRGDIVGDDDVFDNTPLGAGWSWDDAPFYYSAEIGGLVFNENTVDFAVEGRRPGMPASVRWDPFNTDYVDVINSTRTVASRALDDEEYSRKRGTNTIRVASRVLPGTTEREAIAVTNPTLFFTHVLRETLLLGGISVTGRPVDVDALSLKPDYASDAVRRLTGYTSPPLAEIVKPLLKESNNLYAEQLLRTLAAERPVPDADEDVEPGSAEMGVEAAMRTFARAGIDTSRLELADGSGLSRYNLVTPVATVSLLRYMHGHEDEGVREAFYEALAIGGMDGTLEYRFRHGAGRGNVHAKTGTLSSVSSLSGYVTTADGRALAFALMCNNFTVKTRRVRAAQDRIVSALAAARLAAP